MPYADGWREAFTARTCWHSQASKLAIVAQVIAAKVIFAKEIVAQSRDRSSRKSV